MLNGKYLVKLYPKPCKTRGKNDHTQQRDLSRPMLVDLIDSDHKSVLLSNKIGWKYFEGVFEALYSTVGFPPMPVRLMIGCLLLKRIYNFWDGTSIGSWNNGTHTSNTFAGTLILNIDFPVAYRLCPLPQMDRGSRSRENVRLFSNPSWQGCA